MQFGYNLKFGLLVETTIVIGIYIITHVFILDDLLFFLIENMNW
jgi:hypothetical protein